MIELVEKDAETDINILNMLKKVEGSVSAVRHIKDLKDPFLILTSPQP